MARHQAVVLAEPWREDWVELGRGGFGIVYKVKHKDMRLDVAVKVFEKDAGCNIEEATLMDLSSFPYVLRVYGLYQSPSGERGLVTEYMEKGSIETLWDEPPKPPRPPPWPLAFRLVHQTALAMNFIHSREIVHLDLKPNNILLDKYLDVKVTDFGLSKVSTSAEGHSKDPPTGRQGTFKYWPPEAFVSSYKPKRSFDVYSFGILIWAIFSGEEPYPAADFYLLRLNRFTDRPPCGKLLDLEVDGTKELVELMNKCWVNEPSDRPKFKAILDTTEELFSRHSSDIQQDSQTQASSVSSKESREAQPNDSVDGGFVREERQVSSDANSRETKMIEEKGLDVMDSKQASSAGSSKKTLTREEKANFIDRHKPRLIRDITHALAIAIDLGNMVHPETYSIIKVTKVPQHQNRELWEILKGGKKVTEAFYDALKIHESSLMEELEEEDSKAGVQ